MSLRRLSNIAQVFTEEGLGFLVTGDTPQGSDVELAARIRRVCERLGPTFVKFGQVLALRRDAFSDAFCAELGKLHSTVPPFPGEDAVRIIESELSLKIADVFARFDVVPVAAASIAQVHFAKLLTGEEVAVKVQRPEAEASIRDDLDTVLSMSKWLDRLFATYRDAMVHGMAQEFAKMTAKELNFLEEAAVAAELKAALADLAVVHIPTMHRQYCSTRVLVMERMMGPRLDTIKTPAAARAVGHDPEALARTMLNLQVRQAYDIGLLHADMHPGNVFLLAEGKVGLIDFGMSVRIPKELRDKMIRALRLRAAKRYEESFDAFLTVFTAAPDADVAAMKRELRAFAEANDAKPLSELSLGKSLIEEGRIGRKYGMSGPPEMMIIARGLVTVEGIALRLSPGFSPYVELRAIFTELMRERMSPERLANGWMQAIPDLVEAIEMSPELSKTVFRMRRNLAQTNNLADFLALEGFPPRAREKKTTVLWLVLALLVALATGYAVAVATRP